MAKRRLFAPQIVKIGVTPKTGASAPINNRSDLIPTNYGYASSPVLTGKIKKAADFINAVAPGALPAVSAAIQEKGSSIVIDGINRIRTGQKQAPNSQPTPSPGGPITVFTGSKLVEGNTSYALSGAPKPANISLNSGVKPDTFVNDYMQPIENVCSPLHLSAIKLQLPTVAQQPLSALSTYIVNNVAFNMQAKAQQVISFSLDVTTATAFTATNIILAFNDLIYALQVYFYYSSVLSFDSDSHNKNSGMDALRVLVDSATLSDYYQLEKRLQDTPCPPRLVEWIRYMSGNFKSGPSAGSPMIKTVFDQNAFTGARPATSFCSTALTNLNRNNNLNVWVIMRKCYPKWRINNLKDIPIKPLYDPQFTTIFANLVNCNRSSGAAVFSNVVANSKTAIPYNSYTNYLDGVGFAMGWCTDNTTSWPALAISPAISATYPDNRYSYYSVGGTIAFYPVYLYPFLGSSRQETTSQALTISTTPHLFGTDKCQNVTGDAYVNSAQQVIDYMFETKTTLRLSLK